MGRTLVAVAIVTLAANSACGRVGYAFDGEVPSGARDAERPAVTTDRCDRGDVHLYCFEQ